jgi:hypothetical protein
MREEAGSERTTAQESEGALVQEPAHVTNHLHRSSYRLERLPCEYEIPH